MAPADIGCSNGVLDITWLYVGVFQIPTPAKSTNKFIVKGVHGPCDCRSIRVEDKQPWMNSAVHQSVVYRVSLLSTERTRRIKLFRQAPFVPTPVAPDVAAARFGQCRHDLRREITQRRLTVGEVSSHDEPHEALSTRYSMLPQQT